MEMALEKCNYSCAYLFSDMDATSRKINTAKFQTKAVNILVATDIAGRGIDIPELDYVINYNFPSSAKTFIHRVGRAARAGKTGVALSFVSVHEEPYLWDLHRFLGRSVKFSAKPTSEDQKAVELDMDPENLNKNFKETKEDKPEKKETASWNFQFGKAPAGIYSEEAGIIERFNDDPDLQFYIRKRDNAQQMYLRNCPKPSKESLREMKLSRQIISMGDHPLLAESFDRNFYFATCKMDKSALEKRKELMEQIKNVKPKKTIFELEAAGMKGKAKVMQMKRKRDENYIKKYQQKLDEKRAKYDSIQDFKNKPVSLPMVDDEDIQYEFPQVVNTQDAMQVVVEIGERQRLDVEDMDRRMDEKRKSKRQKRKEKRALEQGKVLDAENSNNEDKQNEFFIPYQPADIHEDKG